jgi:hypothetical protein
VLALELLPTYREESARSKRAVKREPAISRLFRACPKPWRKEQKGDSGADPARDEVLIPVQGKAHRLPPPLGVYRKTRLFFLGLILGQIVACGFWIIVDLFTGRVGNNL